MRTRPVSRRNVLADITRSLRISRCTCDAFVYVDDGGVVYRDLQADAVKKVVLREDRPLPVRVSMGIHGVHHVDANNGSVAMEPRVWMKCMESIFGEVRGVLLGGSGSGSSGHERPAPWLGRGEATDQERRWRWR